MPRLMHPQHGWHVTSAGDDIEAMRRAGWVDDDGTALAEKLAAAKVDEIPAPPGFVEAMLAAGRATAPNDGRGLSSYVQPAAKRGPGRPRKSP